MNIEQLNSKHLFEVDMYYRAAYGVSSSLIDFKNQVINLQVVITKRPKLSYASLSIELANIWKENNKELASAIACKVYFVDLYKFPFKRKSNYQMEDYDAKKGVLYYKQYLN